jgi:Flp pilus assembly pilin Flp
MERHGVMGVVLGHVRKVLSSEEGQGTTEYAILVGVLVVIAIVAIIAFKDKVSELWSAIADGVNSL